MFKLWNKLELDGLDWSSEKYLSKKDVILTPLFDTIEKKYESDSIEFNYNVLDYAFSWNIEAVRVGQSMIKYLSNLKQLLSYKFMSY